MTDKPKVVCQECGGPVEASYSIDNATWTQAVDPDTGLGKPMSLEDIDFDDIELYEITCKDHPEHFCRIQDDPDSYEREEEGFWFRVRPPTKHMAVLTERGQGALYALRSSKVINDMFRLLAYMADGLEAKGPGYLKPELSLSLVVVYDEAVASGFIRIVDREVD